MKSKNSKKRQGPKKKLLLNDNHDDFNINSGNYEDFHNSFIINNNDVNYDDNDNNNDNNNKMINIMIILIITAIIAIIKSILIIFTLILTIEIIISFLSLL